LILKDWSASLTSRVAFWAAWTFAFVAAMLPHPILLPGDPSDKVQHMVAFLTLGILSAWAYPDTPLRQLLVRLSLFGALIELLQAIPSLHRDSDPLDWVVDTVAVMVALSIASWWRARSRRAS
jgi:hypothetical protein